jgi:hypothetical protein
MQARANLVRLFRTGCAWGKSRGVLGERGKSRMDFRESSQEGFNSSQGIPERTVCDQRLAKRRKRHVTGDSSTHFCLRLAATRGVLAILLAGAAHAQYGRMQDSQIREAAEGFESIMLQQLHAQMKKSAGVDQADPSNPFAPSHAELIYRSMQEDLQMRDLAKQRTLGVADLIERQLRGQTGIGQRTLIKSVEQAPASASPGG